MAKLAAEYKVNENRPVRVVYRDQRGPYIGEVVGMDQISTNTQERGKTMTAYQDAVKSGCTNPNPLDEKTAKKQNLQRQLDGVRAENAGLRHENERLQAKVLETEARYKELVDVWNASQARGNLGADVGKLLNDPKHRALMGQEFTTARRLAAKLLRFINEPSEED